MTIERFVVLVTPIFAGVSGWLVQWIGEHFPGTPQLNKDQLTALFVLGATAALAAVLKWAHERSKHTLAGGLQNRVPGKAK